MSQSEQAEPSVVDDFSSLYNIYTLEKLSDRYDVYEMSGGGIMILIHKQNKKICLKHRVYPDRGARRYELKVWVENWTEGIRKDALEGLLASPERLNEELESIQNPALQRRISDMKRRGFERFLSERDKKGRIILRGILLNPYAEPERNEEAFYDGMVRLPLIHALREDST